MVVPTAANIRCSISEQHLLTIKLNNKNTQLVDSNLQTLPFFSSPGLQYNNHRKRVKAGMKNLLLYGNMKTYFPLLGNSIKTQPALHKPHQTKCVFPIFLITNMSWICIGTEFKDKIITEKRTGQ